MSFKHYFTTHLTESEFAARLDTINESRWWGKFDENSTSLLEYKDAEGKSKKFKVCKMEEDGTGPAYVLEARGGARYGLFRATEGKFHCVRLKSGKKHLIKPKGIFKEVEGKLVFELFAPKGMQKLGGGKELIQKAIQNKKKSFDPEATLTGGRPNLDVRPGEGMVKPDDKPFDPNMTLRELKVLDAPSSWKDAIAQDPETWTPKPGSVADFSKSSKGPEEIGKLMGGSHHPYKFFVGNDGAVYQVLSDPMTRGVWAVSKTDIDPTPYLKQRDPEQDAKLNEEGTSNEEIAKAITQYLRDVCGMDNKKIRNWWTITDIEDIGLIWDEKVKPWLAQKNHAPEGVVAEDDLSDMINVNFTDKRGRAIKVYVDTDPGLLKSYIVVYKPQMMDGLNDPDSGTFDTFGELMSFLKSCGAIVKPQDVRKLKNAVPSGDAKKIKKNRDGAIANMDRNIRGDIIPGMLERRATAEPDKSFPNGEPTFDKNTDEWNKGVYTDAKA